MRRCHLFQAHFIQTSLRLTCRCFPLGIILLVSHVHVHCPFSSTVSRARLLILNPRIECDRSAPSSYHSHPLRRGSPKINFHRGSWQGVRVLTAYIVQDVNVVSVRRCLYVQTYDPSLELTQQLPRCCSPADLTSSRGCLSVDSPVLIIAIKAVRSN